jgi:hypothetical protein
MGALDNLKNKAQDMAREHSDQIKEGLEKAAKFADSKTGGKHSDKVDKGVEKAKGMVDNFADEPGQTQ